MTGLSVTPPKGNWRAIDPSELSACEGPSVQAPRSVFGDLWQT
jgi:hypothetical protein